MKKGDFAGFLSTNVLVVLVVALLFIWVRAQSGCDVHDRNSSRSPDGSWTATWSTEGCYAVLLTTTFNSKVAVSNSKQPEKSSYLVFESDSPDPVVFGWRSPAELHIEVPSIAAIVRSERSVPGLFVSYGVTKSALLDLDNDQRIPGHKKDAVEDSRVIRDEDYSRYLDQFRQWTREYTPVTP